MNRNKVIQLLREAITLIIQEHKITWASLDSLQSKQLFYAYVSDFGVDTDICARPEGLRTQKVFLSVVEPWNSTTKTIKVLGRGFTHPTDVASLTNPSLDIYEVVL